MAKVFKTKALTKEQTDCADVPKMFYRYEDILLDWNYNLNQANVKIVKYEFNLIRETACGYWIDRPQWNKNESWISKTSRKRFAYPTKHEAMLNFKYRKQRQIKLLEGNLSRAKAALDLCLKELDYNMKEYYKNKLDTIKSMTIL